MSRARTIANFGDGLVTADLPSDLGIVGGDLPTGSVLQVVQGVYSTSSAINSTSYTDTGITVNITPSATSSKVLVTLCCTYQTDDQDNELHAFKLLRDSTAIAEEITGKDLASGIMIDNAIFNVLDEPSTTSQITYKVQARATNANSDIRFNQTPQGGLIDGSGQTTRKTTITAMEIAG